MNMVDVERYVDIDGGWQRLWTIPSATYSSDFLQMEASVGRLDVYCLSYSTEHLSKSSNPNRSLLKVTLLAATTAHTCLEI
jgi:hypothetical protein